MLQNKIELLAPAGSSEALRAAVQSGANAVYLGVGDFNARRNATNFDLESLKQAVDYCHLRNVKVYVTINTLIYDKELKSVQELAIYCNNVGVDAILVQDLGVYRILRNTVPELELHASTQMTLHDLDGVKMVADLGFTRAVLSRELSKREIEFICSKSPIEIEIFVHGALCMCYSGQCFFSSVIGERSGNRGMCAQPCRLNYGWNGKANQSLLSLKDMSLINHLQELKNMGVACLKIEGRMKRPEYVSVVTKIYAECLKNDRMPNKQELLSLEQAFSRQGFTDGYYMGNKGKSMFGIHENGKNPDDLFAKAKNFYSKERILLPVDMHVDVLKNKPVKFTIAEKDVEQNIITVSGAVPENAINRALNFEQLKKQMIKTGGTPFYCDEFTANLNDGLNLPASQLNAIRRSGIDELSRLKIQCKKRKIQVYNIHENAENFEDFSNQHSIECLCANQISDELLRLKPKSITLPLEEYINNKNIIAKIKGYGIECCVVLPRIIWSSERESVKSILLKIKDYGVKSGYTSTLSGIKLLQEVGFDVYGDFGLGVLNSETILELKNLGLKSVVVSFELKSQRIRNLIKYLPTEAYIYGRMPLMIMENCIIKNKNNKCACSWKNGGNPLLTDRRRAKFPVIHAFGCRNEILNSAPIYLADKSDFCRENNLSVGRLKFTLENSSECVTIFKQYKYGTNAVLPDNFTRGLYFRNVE